MDMGRIYPVHAAWQAPCTIPTRNTVRNAVLAINALAKAEFASLRIGLLKIGTHIIETVSPICAHPAPVCPDAKLFRLLAVCLASAGP